jgi:hypothetical protein
MAKLNLEIKYNQVPRWINYATVLFTFFAIVISIYSIYNNIHGTASKDIRIERLRVNLDKLNSRYDNHYDSLATRNKKAIELFKNSGLPQETKIILNGLLEADSKSCDSTIEQAMRRKPPSITPVSTANDKRLRVPVNTKEKPPIQ